MPVRPASLEGYAPCSHVFAIGTDCVCVEAILGIVEKALLLLNELTLDHARLVLRRPDGGAILLRRSALKTELGSVGKFLATFYAEHSSPPVTWLAGIAASLYESNCRMSILCSAAATVLPGFYACLLYTSPSPRDRTRSRMPSSA